MKLIRLATCLLLLAVLLTGCLPRGKTSSEKYVPEVLPSYVPAERATRGPREETEPPELPDLCLDDIVTIYYDRIKVLNPDGEDFVLSFSIPYVDYASADAAICNREIESRYRTAADEQTDQSDLMTGITVCDISYSAYEVSGVIVLRVEMATLSGETSGTIYCFDKDGTFADKTEIVQRFGYTTEEFVRCMTEKITAYYHYTNASDSNLVTYGKYLEASLGGLSDLNFLQLYPQVDGMLSVTVTVYDAHGISEPHTFYVARGGK